MEKDFIALTDATGKFASALGRLAENEEERRQILPELESLRARIDRLVSKIKGEDGRMDAEEKEDSKCQTMPLK